MRKFIPTFLVLGFLAVILSIVVMPGTEEYQKDLVKAEEKAVERVEPKVTHVETPEPLKGIYMTACIASRKDLRAKLVKLIEETELNAVVIDIKDATGVVSFETGNPEIDDVSKTGIGCVANDMQDFINELHKKDIYVIGRLAVFQDPLYTKLHPELAVRKKSDGGVWKDRKGIAFIDVGAKPFWDYILAIADASYKTGFDEINFDYIRFPSDGNMADTNFTLSAGKVKREALREFFEFLSTNLLGTGPKISADIFGMTTTNTDDLGIGQVLEYALQNFDYVAPMVYPSHYPPQFNGWPDPNKVPYEIVKFSMEAAVKRVGLLKAEIATSTPASPTLKLLNPLQLRPWLQDNDYPVHYTADMVRKQIQATYDSGLTSWMLWDPANTYTEAALLKQ
jgi:hypothetical protein